MKKLTAPVATLATDALATSLTMTLSGSASADDQTGEETPDPAVTRACDAYELDVYVVDSSNTAEGEALIAIDHVADGPIDDPGLLAGFGGVTVLSFGQPVPGNQHTELLEPIQPVVMGANPAENAHISLEFVPERPDASYPSGLRLALPGVSTPIDVVWPGGLGSIGSDLTTGPVTPSFG